MPGPWYQDALDVKTFRSEAEAFFGNGDQVNLAFNFLLNNDVWLALTDGRAGPITRCLRELPTLPEAGQWLMFLCNLDELDLERPSDGEREQMYAAFGPDEWMYARARRRVRTGWPKPSPGDDDGNPTTDRRPTFRGGRRR